MGTYSTNEFFYKPVLGASGAVELGKFHDAFDVADAAIKANLDAFATKQPLDTGLTSIAALTTAANKMIYTTALDTYAITSLTAFARTILDDADASTVRATLSAAVLGANADITSLTGLTTPLGATYGGTGVANNALNTITFTGNYTLGLTLTANTAITLPTSGTLITKVGTPVNNQIGVWTGDGTLEGDANLTYDGTTLNLGTGQINFPDSQNASAGANTLDDYEERTYTPTLVCSTSGSYTIAGDTTLAYVKIGKKVYIQGYLSITGETSPNGALRLSLPFASVEHTEKADYAIGILRIDGHGGDIPNPFLFTSSTWQFATFKKLTDAGVLSDITHTDVDTAFTVYVNLTYLSS